MTCNGIIVDALRSLMKHEVLISQFYNEFYDFQINISGYIGNELYQILYRHHTWKHWIAQKGSVEWIDAVVLFDVSKWRVQF